MENQYFIMSILFNHWKIQIDRNKAIEFERYLKSSSGSRNLRHGVRYYRTELLPQGQPGDPDCTGYAKERCKEIVLEDMNDKILYYDG